MVCSGRSLFGSSDTSGHGPGKLRKIFHTSTGAWHLTRGRDLLAHVNWCLAPDSGTRFASISIRDRKGAWHRARGARFASIPIGDCKGAWHRTRGQICQHFDSGIAKVPGTGRGDRICQHFDWGSQRCLARMALYAWGQSASSLAARGSFLLYFRELWQLMMTSK